MPYSIVIFTACIAVAYASFFEWTLHSRVMHRPLWMLRYPFDRHAVVHHRTFKADRTYHLQREEDKQTIPMAWWNSSLLIPLASAPFAFVGLRYTSHPIAITATAMLVIGTYYGAYEYLHWCMHLPRRRVIERTGIFFRLNGHHLLHHRYPHKNFNVVLPLADFLLGTLLLRSQVPFAQARGPSVPDVQPKEKRTGIRASV